LSATFVIERIHGRLVLDHYAQFCQGVEGRPRGVRRFLREAGQKLQNVLATAAAAAHFQFADAEPAFRGHEVCTKDPWIAPLRLRPARLAKLRSPLDLGSFHPNAKGQAAYARVLADYIHSKLSQPGLVTPAGLPANP
jgi:hypothetical protein